MNRLGVALWHAEMRPLKSLRRPVRSRRWFEAGLGTLQAGTGQVSVKAHGKQAVQQQRMPSRMGLQHEHRQGACPRVCTTPPDRLHVVCEMAVQHADSGCLMVLQDLTAPQRPDSASAPACTGSCSRRRRNHRPPGPLCDSAAGLALARRRCPDNTSG